MLGPRAGHAAAACDGHVYAIGGKGPGNVMRSSVEKYDPQVSYIRTGSVIRTGSRAGCNLLLLQ